MINHERLEVGSWWCATEGFTPCHIKEIVNGRVRVEYSDGGWGSFTIEAFLEDHEPSGPLVVARVVGEA